MDRLGNMFIAPEKRGVVHHSLFLSGKPVAFAGLCSIEEGKLKNLIPHSGHYNPELEEHRSFIDQFQTDYLFKTQAIAGLKMKNEKLMETIHLSSKATIDDLHNEIAKQGEYRIRQLTRISHGRRLDNVVGSIAESFLKDGSVISAHEFVCVPHQIVYPVRWYELRILD